MTIITTTPWLIQELWSIQSQKLTYKALIAKLEIELQESDLMQRINKWKEMLKEVEEKEVEVKNTWIEILKKAWIDSFESNWVKVKIKTLPWKLIIENEKEVIEDYKKWKEESIDWDKEDIFNYIKETTKTTTSFDKKEMKTDMKEWWIIERSHLEQEVKLEIKFS